MENQITAKLNSQMLKKNDTRITKIEAEYIIFYFIFPMPKRMRVVEREYIRLLHLDLQTM